MKYRFLLLFVPVIILSNLSFITAENMPFSQDPPGGISAADAPMFVSFGWDDNSYSDGLNWIRNYVKDLKNKDGSKARMTFFNTANRGMDATVLASENQTAQDVLNSWKNLYNDGHEIGNHSLNHPHGSALDSSSWLDQINKCNTFLTDNVEIPASEVYGFRTPFLEYGAGTFGALRASSFTYDCSIEFGFDGWGNPDGSWNGMTKPETHRNLFWPHTLDSSSPPGSSSKVKGSKFPGLWEFMVFTLLKKEGTGVVTGFDFNLFNQATNYNGQQAFEIWKYNFDLHREGNKCPLTLNVHTDYYSDWNTEAVTAFPASTVQTRREAIESFIDYVITFEDVRIVPFITIVNWMRNPVPSAQYVAPDLKGSTPVNPVNNIAAISTKSLSALNSGLIKLNIPTAGNYSLSFYSLNGKLSHTIYNGHLNSGSYTFSPKESRIPNGVYIASLSGVKSDKIKFVVK